MSFVRTVTDVVDLKERIKAAKKTTRVIAKIEKPEAIDEIDNIIACLMGLWWHVAIWVWSYQWKKYRSFKR